jgi:phosphoenolpyruvate synthase/pyruvate phosphate dikinase
MKRGVKLGLLLGAVLTIAAGCAPTNVQQQTTTYTQLPRPDLVMVYDFAVSPDEVKLDTGLSAELMQKYAAHKGTPPTVQEIQLGHKVANVVADEIVKQIRTYGIWAERGYGWPAGRGKVLMVKGQFTTIDQGNRTERVAVGLGAGRSDVQAYVQLVELTPSGVQQVETLRADARSGYKPGMAEMMGVGAIANHLLMSTVVSGTLAGVSEVTAATVEADGKRMADKIAYDIGQFFIMQAWIPPDAVKKPSIF